MSYFSHRKITLVQGWNDSSSVLWEGLGFKGRMFLLGNTITIPIWFQESIFFLFFYFCVEHVGIEEWSSPQDPWHGKQWSSWAGALLASHLISWALKSAACVHGLLRFSVTNSFVLSFDSGLFWATSVFHPCFWLLVQCYLSGKKYLQVTKGIKRLPGTVFA